MTISAVYKITNTVTCDFYIGSSKNVKHRLACHKCQSTWKKYPNNPMYLDMKNYGTDKFEFQVIEEVEPEKLKETEQKFIEILKPTYNSNNAKGLDIERKKEYQKKYEKTDKRKKYLKEYQKSDKYKEYHKEYEKTDKRKKAKKEYEKTDKYKEYKKEYEKTDKRKKYKKEYNSQLCCYNGEVLKLCALRYLFSRAGIPHPQLEAKKYLVL